MEEPGLFLLEVCLATSILAVGMFTAKSVIVVYGCATGQQGQEGWLQCRKKTVAFETAKYLLYPLPVCLAQD
jgi:hypothetical protein